MDSQIQQVKVPRLLEGEVVSTKMDKTIVVKVIRMVKDPLFKKLLKRYKKFKAHDEHGQAQLGDFVELAECRPISKTKHMVLHRIIRKAN